MKHKVIFDKTFTFDLSQDLHVGSLSIDDLIDIFKDGRIASRFLEKLLEIWFSNLVFVDKKGYDHVHKKTHEKFDAKTFTKGGLRFMPSSQIGKGRVFDKKKTHEHAKNISYIFCDIVDFPIVNIIFRKGSEVIKEYPQCIIPFCDRKKVFI